MMSMCGTEPRHVLGLFLHNANSAQTSLRRNYDQIHSDVIQSSCALRISTFDAAVKILMLNAKERFLTGTILSAILMGPVHASALDASYVVAQAPAQTDEDKEAAATTRSATTTTAATTKTGTAATTSAARSAASGATATGTAASASAATSGATTYRPAAAGTAAGFSAAASGATTSRTAATGTAAGASTAASGATTSRRAATGTTARASTTTASATTSGRPAAAATTSGATTSGRASTGAATACDRAAAGAATTASGATAAQHATAGAAAARTGATASAPPGAQPPPQQRHVQPPPGAQPLGQRETVAPGQPPRPVAPQQPVGAPAIAPSALQPPGPPSGSPAAQTQRAFVPPPAQDTARRLDDVRGSRREVREGDRVLIQEPGRVIIRENGRTIIRHNETDRFRWQARNAHVERHGADTVTVFERADGSRIYTVTDETGRLLRRYRRGPDGREIIIIDNRYSGPPAVGGYFVVLPPPIIRIPRERYIVDAQYARPDDIYYALWAAPVDHIDRRYTLDEIRYSPTLRERMPRIDLDTVTFDSGSWEVTPDQVERLAVIADGINRAIVANPSEVFLVEGHTDAVGSDVDNLSLSDRRAESVALVLSQQFGVPAENLTTQGYGEQYLKIPTEGPERANRRVTVRRITPLLTGQNEAVPLPPPQ